MSRRGLLLFCALAVTLALSVISLRLEDESTVVQPAMRAETTHTMTQLRSEPPGQPKAAAAELLARPVLAKAQGDPFGLARPSPIAQVSSPPPAVVQAVPPPPPAVVMPAFPYKFFGRVRDGQGSESMYLSQQDKLILVVKGLELDAGFRIEAFTDSEVQVRHQPTGQMVQLPIPKQVM